MAVDYDKAFTRARLRASDNLRRNGQLSPAARLVGWEILSRVNRVSGCAFPSEATIAACLGVTSRTVKTAIKQLKNAGYFGVRRRGRSNVYFPMFPDQIGEKISPIEEATVSPIGEKSDADRGKKQHQIGEKNDPLTLSSNPIRTLSSQVGSLATAPPTGALRSPQARKQQETENEIANALGWQCFMAMPTAEADDLRKRWPNVEQAEMVDLKPKYG